MKKMRDKVARGLKILLKGFETISFYPPPVQHLGLPYTENGLELVWGRTFAAMRAGILEVGAEIAAERGEPVELVVENWADGADAMALLKRLSPGDATTPNGAERAMRRAEQIVDDETRSR